MDLKNSWPSEFQSRRQEFESFLSTWFRRKEVDQGLGSLQSEPELQTFRESLEYSLLGPGKRFRPLLVYLVGDHLKVSSQKLAPWAAAVEMVHTYSLIHDDLPSLDNDEFRRGRPTHHKVYGEAMALLAGDALLTEAFSVLSLLDDHQSNLGSRLMFLLAEASGVRGMLGGQVLDVFAKDFSNLEKLKQLHAHKTGALIRVCAEGAAVLGQASVEHQKIFRKYGEILGWAFQVADDIHDRNQVAEKSKNLAQIFSLSEAEKILKEASKEAESCLHQLGIARGPLVDLIEFNLQRQS